MAKRSLKASPEGINQAKRAFERRGWTQEYLAAEVGLQTRQPVWKFFSGRPVERHVFLELCFTLDLDWETIVDRPSFSEVDQEPEETVSEAAIAPSAPSVNHWRSHLAPLIQSQCSQLELPLDLSCPITLAQIYTETYLYPRRSTVPGIATISGIPERISLDTATTHHSRLLILGGAGTGKTTLMQYLALQSLEASADGPIPVLLRLRQLALEVDPHLDLLTVIQQTLDPDGLVLPQVEDFWQTHVSWLLLDGWDEITPTLQTTLTQQLQVLLDRHPHLRVIITSRPGTLIPALRGFTVLDLAEFSTHQVEQFVQRWFQANDPETGADRATACLEALHSPANERFHALSLTPMLLHLICLVFWHQRQFPTQAGQLYQQALDLLMGRWDQQRGVVRDRPPLAAALTAFDMLRLLSQVATRTFERNQVLIAKSDLVMLIAQSLTGSTEGATDPEQRWAASQHILQVWVEHYGILLEHAYEVYGFSHLSIQEYLVARRWAISAMDRHEPEDWQALSTHLSDERWRDVMAFTVEMLPDAAMLVQSLHLEAQSLLTDDPNLHAIAAWVEERAIACEQPDQIAALQAHYLGLLVDQDLDLAIALNPDLGFDPPPPLVLDRAIHHLLDMAQGLMHQPSLQAGFNLYFAMDLYQCYALAPEFETGLKELQQSLVQVLETANWLSQWQHSEGTLWLERLHHLCTIHHYHPAVHRLHPSQRLILQQFYQAQQLIVSCAKRSSAPLPQSLFS